MPRRYPPLSPSEVRTILRALGFELAHTTGSHEQWDHADLGGRPRRVTVDVAIGQFSPALVQSMIRQSGVTREEFYGATERSARKIGVRRER